MAEIGEPQREVIAPVPFEDPAPVRREETIPAKTEPEKTEPVPA